jgi:glycerate kinase
VLPLADGGEGTVEALVDGLGGTLRQVTVTGPLGIPVCASYGLLAARRIAVIEMAQAAGLMQVPPELRNPLNTTTYGFGELILDAVEQGYTDFILGIGGSATSEAGLGMLQALGCRFYDEERKPVGIFGRDLERVASIDISGLNPCLEHCTFQVACDVKNPLCGISGAAVVFGPQQGATPEIVRRLDAAALRFSESTSRLFGADYAQTAGAGAAGGLGFALLSYLHASLRPGIELILDAVGFEDLVSGADYVITGEGRLDAQTAMGKAPVGVARIAKKHGATVLAFAGSCTPDAAVCNDHGIDAFFPILTAPVTLQEALRPETARQNLTETVVQVFRLVKRLRPAK